MEIVSKKIEDLIETNYSYAAALHYLGIAFYQYPNQTIAQICRAKGLNIEQVIKDLESLTDLADTERNVKTYDIDLLIEYLRYAHDFFIQRKMPYILHLIENFDATNSPNKYKLIIKDLQILFPLFIEDFIHHIHEEEDTFFEHISTLYKASIGQVNMGKVYFHLEHNSLQKFAVKHNTHDDEMRGIRELTHNYTLESQSPLYLKVIFAELKSLEEELKLHARMEDEVLFPKALILEEKVKKMFKSKAQFN